MDWIKLAKNLRKNQTPEEAKLWMLLRNRRFSKFKFRRQFPIDGYIVDFCCLSKRLIIELDGGQHNQNPADKDRDEYLEKQGFRVLRIWNNELNQSEEAVLEKIFQTLQ